jgi:hypothetical protein
MSELDVITNPEDLPKRRPVMDTSEEIRPEVKEGHRIDYCTEGRFTTPKALHFKGYSVDDIATLTTSSQDELLENLLGILNRLNVEGKEIFNSGEFTPEEFIETLINLKVKYIGSTHKHSWLCECQYNLPEEEQELSQTEIDLKKVEFIDIKVADEDLKSIYKKFFEEDDNFINFLKQKYPDKKEEELKKINIEEELSQIYMKEPVKINVDNNEYSFRFPRMKDLIQGTKKAQNKYKDKIKKAQKKKINPDKNIKEQKEAKKGALDVIRKKIAKDALIYSRALSMVAKNGQPLSDDEKFNEWKEFNSTIANELSMYFNPPFGLQAEYDMWCSHCDHIKRRSLRNEPTLIWELLPIDDSSDRGDMGKSARPFVHISF